MDHPPVVNRAVDGGRRSGASGTATAADPTGAKARREATATSKKVARPSKRTGGVDTKAESKVAARSGNPKKAAAAVDRVMASVAEKVADHQVVEKAIVLQTLASFSTES